MTQQRLFEFRMGERSPATLVVTRANEDAARLLTDWRAWPGGALALVGPKGAGKTHLALGWALETGARALSAAAAPEAGAALFEEAGGRLWIDPADGPRDEGMLWRVLDLARARGGAVLLTAVRAPAEWETCTPDLRSRLSALPVARLGEPDEALLEVVLRRICRERFIELSEDGVQYLAARMPHTFAAVHALADALDALVVKGAKPVSAGLARKALARVRAAWASEEEAQSGEREGS